MRSGEEARVSVGVKGGKEMCERVSEAERGPVGNEG